MKKSLLMMSCVALMTLASCHEVGDSTSTMNVTTCNLITATDGSADATAVATNYSYQLNLTKGSMVVTASGLMLNGQTTGFTSDAIKYDAVVVNTGDNYGTVINANATNPATTTGGMAVTDFKVQLTPLMYVPPTVSYQKDTSSSLPQPDLTSVLPDLATLMSYNIGNKYEVRTFWPDQTFSGTTTTWVGDDESTKYTNTKVLYRIKMNIQTKKAMVAMYNVKLNEAMPEMTILILPEVGVTFTDEGITIEGEDIAPLYIEGGNIMENTNFVFNTFKYKATGNLVNATIDYTVAGRFRGTFSGRYMEVVGSTSK